MVNAEKAAPRLELRELTKFYETGSLLTPKKKRRRVVALDKVSLTLKPGLYGLLGPNGAGKSTLIGIITGSLRETSGQVLYNGRSIRALGAKYREKLGYMPQQQNLYDSFTGRRFLTYLGTLKGIPGRKLNAETERAAAAFHLSEELDKRLSAYSGGMKQRLLAASAILGDPTLIILDEPTAGLDPKERVGMRNYMKSLSREKIVLMATHVVSDVEGAADCIIFLKKGQIAAMGSPKALLEQCAPKAGQSGLEALYLEIFGEA